VCIGCYRNLQDDFESYEASVKKLNEETQIQQQQQQQQGLVPAAEPVPPGGDAMCQICHKTKFADGVGNQCHYCGLRSCSRCGSKAALRSDKVRRNRSYASHFAAPQ